MYKAENNIYHVSFQKADGNISRIEIDAPDMLKATMKAFDKCPEACRVKSIEYIPSDNTPTVSELEYILTEIDKDFRFALTDECINFCFRYSKFIARAVKENTPENKIWLAAKLEKERKQYETHNKDKSG